MFVLFTYWYTYICIYYSNLLTTQNIIYLSDKAMLTVCCRFLCTEAICIISVIIIVLYYALTVHSQVTLHRSCPVEFRLCFPLVKSGCLFYMLLQYLTLNILLFSWFMPNIFWAFLTWHGLTVNHQETDCTMPTAGNVCLLSGGVGPQSLLRRPQWLFLLVTACDAQPELQSAL